MLTVEAQHPQKASSSSSGDVLRAPDVRHIEFTFEDFVKNDLNIRVDKDEQLCRDYLSGSCLKGSACPLRHARPSFSNFRPSSPSNSYAHARTVCKHWLRGLCKKGNACEYLHEYNLRKMPECWFFGKFGYCSSGDECMYLHVGPEVRRGECRAYTRGFCPLGPHCTQKHVRRILCPLYLSGFCPNGHSCPDAHPPYHPKQLDEYVVRTTGEDKEPQQRPREQQQQQQQNTQDEANTPSNAPSLSAPIASTTSASAANTRAKRNMDEILCFKCGQTGHFANICPNPSVPGMRGGVERGPGGRVLQEK